MIAELAVLVMLALPVGLWMVILYPADTVDDGVAVKAVPQSNAQ